MKILQIGEKLQVFIRLDVADETPEVHETQFRYCLSLVNGDTTILVSIYLLVTKTEIPDTLIGKCDKLHGLANREVLVPQLLQLILAGNLQFAIMPDAILAILLANDIQDITVLLHLLTIAVLLQQHTDGFVLHKVFYVNTCLTLRIDNLRLTALGKDNLLKEQRISEVEFFQFPKIVKVDNFRWGVTHRESLQIGEMLQEAIVGDDIATAAPVKHEYRCRRSLSSIHDAVAIGVDVLETV